MTGLEALVLQEATKAIASVVIKSAWDAGGGLFKRISLNETIQQKIFDASCKYVENYTERHGILKVLGMQEPVKLESVYADVQFLGPNDIRRFESIDSLEDAYRHAQRRSFQSQKSPKQDGLQVANEKQYLMVLGGPGAGKSTFLRLIGLEALKGKRFQHACIPVFLELKAFTESPIDIENVIAREFQTCGFPKPEESTQKLLQQGKLLVLLDGLDEVPTSLTDEASRQIHDFVDRYDTNRFIASCRVAAYRHNQSFCRFTDVAMADFDDAQRLTFITNWFGRDVNTAKTCWEKLNSPEYQAAKELTQTPLLLTLVCLLYQRSRKFPTNRATLYERALRVLLEEWAAEKGLPQEDVYKGLDTKRKEMMLSEIAYSAFQEDRLFLPRRDITNQIEQLLKELLPDEKVVDGAATLRAIEQQHGILVERAEGIYSFSHLTIQEYLTAQYIDDHRQVESLVTNHLTDEGWREVFLLVAGLMRGGADELLLQMEQQAKIYLNTPKLNALFHGVHQATTGSDGNYPSAAKRATVMFFALDLAHNLNLTHALDLTLDLNLIRALDLNLAFVRTLAREFETVRAFRTVNLTTLSARLARFRARIAGNRQPTHLNPAFAEQVLNTWYNALNLNPECVILSDPEISPLENYFYICKLIVQCKEASVRVSPKTWEGIEARMVTAPALKPGNS